MNSIQLQTRWPAAVNTTPSRLRSGSKRHRPVFTHVIPQQPHALSVYYYRVQSLSQPYPYIVDHVDQHIHILPNSISPQPRRRSDSYSPSQPQVRNACAAPVESTDCGSNSAFSAHASPSRVRQISLGGLIESSDKQLGFPTTQAPASDETPRGCLDSLRLAGAGVATVLKDRLRRSRESGHGMLLHSARTWAIGCMKKYR